MLSNEARKELEKQQYRVIGDHSAVKTCGWTKKMVRGEGGCYKLKFYGIMSNQCMQMTTSISCANRCKFCWRGYKAPVSKDWKWGVDDPKMILEESKKAHHKLLIGFKGHEKVVENPGAYVRSLDIKHVALSLTGEPIMYPRMNELLDLFHAEGISTFIVTNAQYPEAIRDLKPITQLYISLDAPNKELLKEIDVPLFADYWERLNESLEYLAQKKYRTCIRCTVIKGMNDVEPENYAKLIMKGDPDFLEIKAYMYIGASVERLKRENMPMHEEVIEFSKQLLEHLPDYEIVSEHIASRVVMLAKKKYKQDDKWMTWIDFPKFQELATSGKEFTSDGYLKRTPITGLSGKGTKDLAAERQKKYEEKKKTPVGELQGIKVFVNEKDEELDFYKPEKPCSGC